MDLPPIATHSTNWQLASPPTLNIALDGCIVPCGNAARVDYAHVVVLDNFIDEPIRQQLLDFLTEPGWQAPHPPSDKWSRDTADYAAAARTWGVRDAALEAFAAADSGPDYCWAKVEVQSRLAALYPDMTISHMPSHLIQQPGGVQEEGAVTEGGSLQQQQQQQDRRQQHPETQQEQQQQEAHQQQQQQQHLSSSITANCTPYLANAAVAGDAYAWHVDADPVTFPTPSPWTAAWGTYTNRDPGKPLLFSLLLYLDGEWRREWQAETLLLDSGSGTGVVVVPRPLRALLLDQDVVHRLVAPAPAAGRPRYSLVWKLVMVPKPHQGDSADHHYHTTPGPAPAPAASATTAVAANMQPACPPSLARPEWGPPTYFGTAATVQRVAKAVAAGGVAGMKQQRGAATHGAGKGRPAAPAAAAAAVGGGGGQKRQAPQADAAPVDNSKQQRAQHEPPQDTAP